MHARVSQGMVHACASQTKMAQSRAADMMCPSPVQRTALTALVWLPMANRQRRVCASQTRTLLSLDPLASRRQGSATCAGSHATDVTHFVCPGREYSTEIRVLWLYRFSRYCTRCTLLSLGPQASRRQGSATCARSYATTVINFVWPGTTAHSCKANILNK